MNTIAIRLIALFILLLVSLPVMAANFYKCKSSSGDITFNDKPCPKESKTTDKGKLNSFRISGTVGSKEYTDNSPEPDTQTALIFRAKFTGILESLTPLKRTITQYYFERGKWPEDLEAMGFDNQSMQSKDIRDVRIKKNGKIVAMLKERHGKNKIIILNPKPAMGGTSLDWQCWSNFPRSLLGGGELEICGSRHIY